MKHHEESTFDETVSELARKVDYWKRRAIKAEEKLELSELESILTGPIAKEYKQSWIHNLTGENPEERLAELKQKYGRNF